MVCKFHKTLFSNVFFPPPYVRHFQTRPRPRSKFGRNPVGAYSLQPCHKNEYDDPNYFVTIIP